ncbi:multidrug resistance protein fnx1 [Xylariales sp. AK1849]|nr:multidrug resistance protein fnx1 [Xylariales sp. AK1849]
MQEQQLTASHHDRLDGEIAETRDPGTVSSDAEKNEGYRTPIIAVSTGRLILVLSGVWFGSLLVALDTTLLATIVAPVSATFDSFNKLSWIVTTFTIGSAISQPLSGHLTDIFGRHAGLVVCYALLILGTLLCGLSPYAHALWLFLAGRILQGLGGGSLLSITAFIESDMVPLHKRALVEGIGNVVFGATLAVGGAYGGAINDALGWNWAYLILTPIIFLNAVIVILVVRIPRPQSSATRKPIDYLGCVSVLLAITLLQYGVNSGSSASWNSPAAIVPLVISGTSIAVCLWWDSCRSANPLIPVWSFLERTVASSQISYFFNSAATAAIFYYVPIYLQVLGASARDSGIRFIPYAVAFGLGSSGAGYIIKRIRRYYGVNIVLQVCSVAGTTGLCTMDASTPDWTLYIYLVLLGVGFGGAYVTRLMGLLSSVDQEKQAVIQAASWTISSTGSTLGISAASAIFQGLSSRGLSASLGADDELTNSLRGDFEALRSLTGDVRDEVVSIYLDALRGVFFFALGSIVLAAVASFAMRNNWLGGEDVVQEQAPRSLDLAGRTTEQPSELK